MKFTQLKSTPTAENLNNRVAQMFGSKIKLESFTVEQLTAARDKLANQLQVIENQANFDAIHSSEAYQKNRLFLKVIEQRITELSQTTDANAPQAQTDVAQPTATPSTPVEQEESVEETMTKQHFQYVADTLKDIQDPIKKAEYAKHHSAIFQHFNPRFDHAKFMAAAGVEMKEPAEAVAEDITNKGKDFLMKAGFDPMKIQAYMSVFNDHGDTSDIKKMNMEKVGLADAMSMVLASHDIENESAVAEAKPDFLDMDKDGNKKEPMKKAIKDKEKKKNIKEAAEDTAKIVMAANSMVDKITGWLEDTAKMQTEVNLDLGDEIRNEMGSEKAEEFIAAMKPAIEQLYTQLETVRKSFTGGVAVLTGEEAPATLGADAPTDDIEDLETEVEPEVTPDTADDFTASEPATGGEEPADRKKRESIIRRSPKLAEMLSRPFIGKKKV